jgi:hypothetical protein
MGCCEHANGPLDSLKKFSQPFWYRGLLPNYLSYLIHFYYIEFRVTKMQIELIIFRHAFYSDVEVKLYRKAKNLQKHKIGKNMESNKLTYPMQYSV